MFTRLILAVLLSLGLLISGISSAHSNGLMAGSSSIVICSPKGVHEILLGANGEPISVAHHCFECCPISLDGLAALWPDFVGPFGYLSNAKIAGSETVHPHVPLIANARAPPIVG